MAACFRRGGAGDGRRGLERSGRALESGREDGRRPRATNANLVAHSALPTSRSRTPRGPRSARPGRSKRARTDEACMLLGSRKRTDDPSGGG